MTVETTDRTMQGEMQKIMVTVISPLLLDQMIQRSRSSRSQILENFQFQDLALSS
jgi:hypothetical protein